MPEYLVEFDIRIPEGTPESVVSERQRDEADAAADLAKHGRLVRLWEASTGTGQTRPLGLFRADGEPALHELLDALPVSPWMHTVVTPLTAHPNDPAPARPDAFGLPAPRVTPVYRLDATVGPPIDVGVTARGRRRIVPITGGTFTGPHITGTLVPGASADWQTVLADGTTFGDVRYTLQTDGGSVLSVQSHGVRHGPPDVLARLGQGDDVDPAEYTFRTSTRIEAADPALDWFNKGIFISVGGRRPGGVSYETYLVA